MTEPDQYDAIGEQWEGAVALAAYAVLERGLDALAGDVRGLDVLDIACGTGAHARRWAAHGARRVVGTDRSTEMIAAARTIERERPAGIEYRVADALDHPALGPFDLVSAAFLLNYAWDSAALTTMARTLHDNLRPGGRVVGVLPAPEFRFDGASTRRFGFDFTPGDPVPGMGPGLRVTMLADPPFGYDCVLTRRAVYDTCLVRAGLTAPRWTPMHEADPELDPSSARQFADNTPLVLFDTSRPG